MYVAYIGTFIAAEYVCTPSTYYGYLCWIGKQLLKRHKLFSQKSF